MPAFALAAVAYRRDLATGEAVSLALRDALFEDGRNIAEPAVLAEISERYDLESPTAADRRRTLEDWHDGRARGVVGSPHFFIAGRSFFCASLDIAKVDGHLRITTKEDGLNAMLEAALGRVIGRSSGIGLVTSRR